MFIPYPRCQNFILQNIFPIVSIGQGVTVNIESVIAPKIPLVSIITMIMSALYVCM